ncbi:TAXI family TRAP transporter solute-binding subunit [Texcoconibacillus texcoconensis]|uniref:TAXI family TRAP transporter solute-binding subunit n=1 Tax=Texcoconibacillus texcoconensis TaxID=1095777 RepID=A0A840QS65_9BACI|nr:TAXI family TRAP transporter solute-binding subunit [Texcoconibacillus texcoconensis]MBB5174346.1 hypothetical protein [Texcoconibacillus texcoconensis]
MKKKFYTLLSGALASTLVLAACGEEGNGDDVDDTNEDGIEDAGEETEASDVDVSNLQLGTGSTGGTYFPLGQQIAEALNEHIDVDDFDLSSVSTGASVDNISSIYRDELHLGMTVHLPALDALTGAGAFEGVEMDNFGFMGHIYPEVMQIVTTEGTGVETLADLEGKSVAIGPPGSGTQEAAKTILEAAGLEEGDYEAMEEGFGDATSRIQDGNLDASFGLLGLPNGSIEELEVSGRDVKILDIDDETLATIEEVSGYEGYEIPEGSYDFLEDPVQTVTAYAVMVGSTDTIDEDLGYEITKTMFEHSDAISHQQGDHMTKDNAMNGSEGLPIHPGAEKYFEEEGILE